MTERRKGWNENAVRKLMAKQDEKQSLMARLQTIRTELQSCGTDFERYDRLKAEQREITAKIITM